MEKLLLVILIIAQNSISQTKKNAIKNNNSKKKNQMEYYNADLYKYWEIDNSYSPSMYGKSLKKGNDRVKIWRVHDKIQVDKTSQLNPYTKTFVYYQKTKSLCVFVVEFYQFSVGITKTYDETGKLIKEVDHEKPYLFSLQQLINKIKKDYGVDIEDSTTKSTFSIHRWKDENLNRPVYELYLRSKKFPDSELDYYLIDGITGELLYQTSCPNRSETPSTPYDEYIDILKNKETEDNSYYKSYKGKDYTKKEWEAFEEEWYRDFEEKKEGRNFFWDNIFKKLNE